MGIPSQSLTVQDPGLGVVGTGDSAYFYVGCAQKGALNTVLPFRSKNNVIATYGQGPLAEDICYALDVAGGPVYACRVNGTVAATSSAVSKAAVGSSTGTITVAGAAYDAYEAVVSIVSSGTVGVARFSYSLDRGRTLSEELTVPGGGTFAVPNTNLTLTFTPGGGAVFFERGDVHSFSTTAPHYSATEVSAAVDALGVYLSAAPDANIDAMVLSGRNATGSAAATMFGAISVLLVGLAQRYRYLGLIMDAASLDTKANVRAALAAVADSRVCAHYGDADIVSSKGFAGWGAPRCSGVRALAGRAAASLISTDLARYASGALPGVLAIYHDEFLFEEMSAAKISTLRTWPNSAGYYICDALMKSPGGSDFRFWQHRRCMDVACRTTVLVQQNFIGIGVATNDNGSIEEAEAVRLESIARGPLENALINPKNAEGRGGHISEFNYSIDRTNNVLTTDTVQSEVAIRPLGYAKHLVTQIGFAANVG